MRHLGFGEARDRGAFPHRGHLGFFEVNFGTVSMVGRERNSKLPSPLKVCVCVCVWEEGGGLLEKEMATRFSILAWEIPWREEPGGLQSLGSQRVGHD